MVNAHSNKKRAKRFHDWIRLGLDVAYIANVFVRWFLGPKVARQCGLKSAAALRSPLHYDSKEQTEHSPNLQCHKRRDEPRTQKDDRQLVLQEQTG
jgi:hypothetical protein